MLPADEPASILSFWFEECRPVQWFRADPEFDACIAERFGHRVKQAIQGELMHWEQHPDSALALVLLLDQFTRQIWRHQPRAFSGDPTALRISLRAEVCGWIADEPSRPKRQFWLMPRLHSEDLSIQTAAVPLFELWTDPRTTALARRYREIIASHGRFPHRDPIRQRSPERNGSDRG